MKGLSEAKPPHFHFAIAAMSTALAVAGIGLAYLLYGRKSDLPDKLSTSLPSLYRLSLNRFYLDEIFAAILVKPLQVFASICRVLDQYVIDGLVDFVGTCRASAASSFAQCRTASCSFMPWPWCWGWWSSS